MIVCKFMYLLLLLLCFLILFFCLFVYLFVFLVVIRLLLFCFFRDISLNTYVIEAVGFSDLSMKLVENLNYKGLRQSEWISPGETLQSIAELVL